MSKKTSSMTTRSAIADRGNLVDERRGMDRDQPNMIDQENSIIIGQKSIADDQNSMFDEHYAVMARIT